MSRTADDPRETPPLATRILGDDESVSTAVVRAVSEASGTAPTELPPLWEAIDADALDKLFPTARTDRVLCFEYAGHVAVVRDATRVEIYPTG